MLKRNLVVALGALSAVAFAGALATSAIGADDPIKTRKELMKTMGGGAKTLGGMLKGDVAFDGAKAAEAANAMNVAAVEFVKHFPDTSKEGGETEASPKIWENMADFEAKAKTMADDAAAVAVAAAAGEAQFKEAAGKMFGNCKSCHEAYRVMK
jgi:cytochrome c556